MEYYRIAVLFYSRGLPPQPGQPEQFPPQAPSFSRAFSAALAQALQPPQAEQPPLPCFLRHSETAVTAATNKTAAMMTTIFIALMSYSFSPALPELCSDRPRHEARTAG